ISTLFPYTTLFRSLAVHRVDIEMQVVVRPELETEHCVVTILVADLEHRSTKTRDHRVVDLLDRASRIVCEQPRIVDHVAGRQSRAAGAGIVGHGRRCRRPVAAGRVTRLTCTAALVLSERQACPADRFETRG